MLHANVANVVLAALAALFSAFLFGMNIGIVTGPRHPPQPRTWTTQRDGLMIATLLAVLSFVEILYAR